MNKNISQKHSGFTLLELLVVIAIIALLSAIVMAALTASKGKSNDSKIQSQLKSMIAQAQLFTGNSIAVSATTTPIVGTPAGNLFTDTNTTNSLYRLAKSLPSGTVVYYGKDGTSPLAGGFWAFAASTSKGSFCVDHTGIAKSNSDGVPMTTSNASSQWPGLSSSFTCN